MKEEQSGASLMRREGPRSHRECCARRLWRSTRLVLLTLPPAVSITLGAGALFASLVIVVFLLDWRMRRMPIPGIGDGVLEYRVVVDDGRELRNGDTIVVGQTLRFECLRGCEFLAGAPVIKMVYFDGGGVYQPDSPDPDANKVPLRCEQSGRVAVQQGLSGMWELGDIEWDVELRVERKGMLSVFIDAPQFRVTPFPLPMITVRDPGGMIERGDAEQKNADP